MNGQQRRQIAVFLVMTVALAVVALNGVLPSHPLTGAVRGGWSKLAAGAQIVVSPLQSGGLVVKEPEAAPPDDESTSPTETDIVNEPATQESGSSVAGSDAVKAPSAPHTGSHHQAGHGSKHATSHGSHHGAVSGHQGHGNHGHQQGGTTQTTSKKGHRHGTTSTAHRLFGDTSTASTTTTHGSGHAKGHRHAKARSGSLRQGQGHLRTHRRTHGHGHHKHHRH